MNSRHYARVLRRAWTALATFAVLGTILGACFALATTKMYEASVRLFAATAAHPHPRHSLHGQPTTPDRVRSYASIAATPAVTGAVIAKLTLDLTDQQLADEISADVPAHTVLLDLHVTDSEPLRAARLVNAVAVQLAEVVKKTDRTAPTGTPAVKLKVIAPAVAPASPITPRPAVDVGVGALLGLLLGVCVVLLGDPFGGRIRTPEDAERLGLPVLGDVALDGRARNASIAFRDDPGSTTSDSYRLLRTRLDARSGADRPRIVAVTSALPGEGRTSTALNLAAALAVSGYRVCLLELDLRRPTLARSLGLANEDGFTTAVTEGAPIASVMQNVGQNLAVITAGPLPPNPDDMAMSIQSRAILEEVAARVDYTIIDTSALLAATDAAHVAAIADATIVVVRAGSSTRAQARRSIETLARVGVTPVGVVLTRAAPGHRRHEGIERPRVAPRPGRAPAAPHHPGADATIFVGAGTHDGTVGPREAAAAPH